MKTLLRFAAGASLALSMGRAALGQHYIQTDLQSNAPGTAEATDSQLVNPRALAPRGHLHELHMNTPRANFGLAKEFTHMKGLIANPLYLAIVGFFLLCDAFRTAIPVTSKCAPKSRSLTPMKSRAGKGLLKKSPYALLKAP
jgi:hypothetical protein